MDHIRIINGTGVEAGCVEIQLLQNGEYVTIAGTGVQVTKTIWTQELHIVHAFEPMEYVTADGSEMSETLVFAVDSDSDGTIHATTGDYEVSQKLTIIDDNRINVNVSCRSTGGKAIEKLMSGLFFMPNKKLNRTYDVLDFAWLPNLHLKEEHVCGHHFFRSPVAMVAADGYYVAIIPDLDDLSSNDLPFALDLRAIDPAAEAPVLRYGVCTWEPDGHVYAIHERGNGVPHKKEFSFSYTVLVGTYGEYYEVANIISDYLWKIYGDRYYKDIRPQVIPFAEYGQRYTYRYELWDTLKYDQTGKMAGLNNIHRRGANFHAWENDLTVAYGIKHYGDTWQEQQLSDAADAIKNTVLQSPSKEGAFPCVFNFETNSYEGSLYWTARAADFMNGYDSAAMGVTAWWALYWYNDFEKDPFLLEKVKAYCTFLVSVQESSGAIPTYFLKDLSPAKQLRESATTCISGAVLAKCAAISNDDHLKDAAIKCGEFVVKNIIPSLHFNDFETYYSCSPKPLYAIDYYTGIRPHCNLSLQWACDQMLVLYQLTQDMSWLKHGEYLLSILSLYQQVWDPSFYPEYLYGGFGVLNTDGEWNDGRQARFVPTYADYYMTTGKTQYLKRAVAACRASFALMDIKENHEQGINSLVLGRDFMPNGAGQGKAKAGQGYAPENFHHTAILPPKEPAKNAWTGMNWSSGGGLTASAYLERHLGAAHISVKIRELICIDGLVGRLQINEEEKIVIEIAQAFHQAAGRRNVKISSSDEAHVLINGESHMISKGAMVEIDI